jgi:hypothetical protein
MHKDLKKNDIRGTSNSTTKQILVEAKMATLAQHFYRFYKNFSGGNICRRKSQRRMPAMSAR